MGPPRLGEHLIESARKCSTGERNKRESRPARPRARIHKDETKRRRRERQGHARYNEASRARTFANRPPACNDTGILLYSTADGIMLALALLSDARFSLFFCGLMRSSLMDGFPRGINEARVCHLRVMGLAEVLRIVS